MHFQFRNVNDAFATLVRHFHTGETQTVKRPSRYGDVMMIEEPVIVTYAHPLERVLFNRARDANPFFHLYEALWMLAGRNDVEPLAYYNSKMSEFSDDGRTFNGAYGYRWRHAEYPDYEEVYQGYVSVEPVDQLQVIIDHLTRLPESRRAVLQMWNVGDDLIKIGSDLDFMQGKESKDVCCNTCVYFSIRQGRAEAEYSAKPYLDMTICNRSNDLVWGMLGANVVHFSFLQEYVAGCLGLQVGVYNQMTNNLHAYTARWEPEKWLDEYRPKQICSTCHGEPFSVGMREFVSHGPCDLCGNQDSFLRQRNYEWDYSRFDGGVIPLVQDQVTFDQECAQFVDQGYGDRTISLCWKEPFLQHVAFPMRMAFMEHKNRRYDVAFKWMDRVKTPDWNQAGREWLEPRRQNWQEKLAKETV